MNPLHDPRPQWLAREPELDHRERQLERYVLIAESLDPASKALAIGALTDLRNARGGFNVALVPLNDAIESSRATSVELAKAHEAAAVGTLDRKVAIRQHEDIVALEARLRYYEPRIREHVAVCNGERERVAGAMRGEDVGAVDETRELLARLFEHQHPETILEVAQNFGRRARAGAVAWWPIAEALVRSEFPERLKVAKRESKEMIQTPSGEIIDWRRVPRQWPTPADLERCFAARRAGRDSELRRVAALHQQLAGQLADLGGAA
jgi:hypothetical protein